MDDSEDARIAALKAAVEMVNLFGTVAATRFDLTINDRQGRKIRFRANVLRDDLRRMVPDLLESATPQQHNIILRPRGPGMQFVQLDDLDADQLLPLESVAFLQLETSPGNFQAWIALPGEKDKDFERRLRKGVGADDTASGATRIAGSLNFKDKYAPDFTRVRIAASSPGRITTRDQLEALGLVAAPEIAPIRPAAPPRQRPGQDTRRWPSYAICLSNARPKRDGSGPDLSKVDFVFCRTCLTPSWGWSIEETTARLMQESEHARQEGKDYALRTVANAAESLRTVPRPPGRG
jgi:hypothetical protein